MRRRGKNGMRRRGDTETPRRLESRPRVPASFFLRVFFGSLIVLFALTALGQTGRRIASQPENAHETLSREDLETVEKAIGVVCLERQRDGRGSLPIDDMQKRPSLPLQAPEVIRGAARAQRLLPVARQLVITSLRRLLEQAAKRTSAIAKMRRARPFGINA